MVEMRKRPVLETVIYNKPDFERKNAQVEGEKEAVVDENPVVEELKPKSVSSRKRGRPRKSSSSVAEDVRMGRIALPVDFLSKVDLFIHFYNYSEQLNLSRPQFFMEAVESFIKDKYPNEYKRLKFGK